MNTQNTHLITGNASYFYTTVSPLIILIVWAIVLCNVVKNYISNDELSIPILSLNDTSTFNFYYNVR